MNTAKPVKTAPLAAVPAFFAKLSRKLRNILIKTSDRGIITLWCAACGIVLFLLFLFTGGMRLRLLGTHVNEQLSRAGDGRFLQQPVSSWGMRGEAVQTGSWWTMAGAGIVGGGGDTLGVVFPIAYGGAFASFLGIAGNSGIEIIPLTESAKVIKNRLPPGMTELYADRIERAARRIAERRAVLAARNN